MFEEKGHSFFAKNEGNKIAIVTIRDYFVVRIGKKQELLFVSYSTLSNCGIVLNKRYTLGQNLKKIAITYKIRIFGMENFLNFYKKMVAVAPN